MIRLIRRYLKYPIIFLILYLLINLAFDYDNHSERLKKSVLPIIDNFSIEKLKGGKGQDAFLNSYLSRLSNLEEKSNNLDLQVKGIKEYVDKVNRNQVNAKSPSKDVPKIAPDDSFIKPIPNIIPPPDDPIPKVESAKSLHSNQVILSNENSPEKNKISSITPTIVFACNRPTVSIALDKLLISRRHFDSKYLPIIVSQDTCNHPETKNKILQYVKENDHLYYLEQTDTSDAAPELNAKQKRSQLGYFKLARHYKNGINSIFDYNQFERISNKDYLNTDLEELSKNIENVIIMEDDLECSDDFYSYMLAGEEVMSANPNIYCVSCWNDNGKNEYIDQSPAGLYTIHYSDFFPGLGWLLKKSIWEEWSSKWPKAYWDDWVRSPEQRLDRTCLRPEISRTHTFGKKGVSNGQFFDKHLKYIALADTSNNFVSLQTWSKLLKPLRSSTEYNEQLLSQVKTAEKILANAIKTKCPVLNSIENEKIKSSDYNFKLIRIEYDSEINFKTAAKTIGLMSDSKSGVPRTAYLGIVQARFQGCRVFITPSLEKIEQRYLNYNGYDTKWRGQP